MSEVAGTIVELDRESRCRLLLPLLQEHAATAASWFALSAPALRFYVGRGAHGFIPVLEQPGHAIALGEPIANPEAVPVLVKEFLAHAREAGVRPVFFPVSGAFLARLGPLGLRGIAAAVEPVIFLDGFSLAAPAGRKLRQAMNRAEHAGFESRLSFAVQTTEVERQGLEAVVTAWRTGRGPQAAELLFTPDPFVAREAKRYAIGSVEGEPVLFASLAPLPGRNGWLVEGLYRHPEAPGGAGESLLAQALEELRDEGFSLVSLGPSVLAVGKRTAEYDEHLEPRSTVANGVFRWLYAHAPELLNYRSAHQFKRKFNPDRMEPGYLAFPGEQPDAALLHAFASAAFLGFDFKGLIHELWAQLSSAQGAENLLADKEE